MGNDVEIMDQKCLMPGHSYLPNDRNFDVIEMSLKKKLVIIGALR